MNIRVIVADDHPVVRIGMVTTLIQSGLCKVVAEASNADELWSAIGEHECDVVVTDLSMPGSKAPDGVELVRALVEAYPTLRILVFTSTPRPSTLRDLIASGAHGMLDKSSAMKELPQAVLYASQGRRYISLHLAGRLDESGYAAPAFEVGAPLSPREFEVVRFLAAGHTNVSIAHKLNLSHKTISRHKREAMRKLSATSERDLYESLLRLGLPK